eukprot:3894577-Prorocentrum_lima.AAC.1
MVGPSAVEEDDNDPTGGTKQRWQTHSCVWREHQRRQGSTCPQKSIVDRTQSSTSTTGSTCIVPGCSQAAAQP